MNRTKQFHNITVPWDLSEMDQVKGFKAWTRHPRGRMYFTPDGKSVWMYILSLTEYQAANHKFKPY